MTSTAASRRLVLVPASARRPEDPVRRFRLARMRVEAPARPARRAGSRP